MNRPYWLDFVYFGVWMLPPALLALVASRMIGLSGIVGLAAFFGILFVAIAVWFVILVIWSRYSKSETETNIDKGT